MSTSENRCQSVEIFLVRCATFFVMWNCFSDIIFTVYRYPYPQLTNQKLRVLSFDILRYSKSLTGYNIMVTWLNLVNMKSCLFVTLRWHIRRKVRLAMGILARLCVANWTWVRNIPCQICLMCRAEEYHKGTIRCKYGNINIWISFYMYTEGCIAWFFVHNGPLSINQYSNIT